MGFNLTPNRDHRGRSWFPFNFWAAILALLPVGSFAVGQDFATNTYTSSTEDFANPERGFYIQADSYASAPSTVPPNLASYRTYGRSSPGNTYTAKIALLLRVFYLDTFVNAPISASFLSAMQADFDSIRAQGCKAVVRFAYNQDQTSPFAEPTKPRILAHIEQLKPLLKQNSDVIAVLQQGFIGAWGEGYYTDIFYTGGQATAQNWLDRTEMLNALLAALPTERMIQVRTPQMKQKLVYDPTASPASAPLSPSAAFTGSGPARIGFHNDCYLADGTDMGGGTSAQDISNLRNRGARHLTNLPTAPAPASRGTAQPRSKHATFGKSDRRIFCPYLETPRFSETVFPILCRTTDFAREPLRSSDFLPRGLAERSRQKRPARR